MGLPRTAASAVLSSVAFLGCTALLGSFEVTDSPPATPEGGGSDGPITGDSGDAADAPVEAGLPMLKCTVSANNIRTIDVARLPPNCSGGCTNQELRFDRVQVFRIADNQVRIVSRPSHSEGFVVYDFNPRQGGAPQILDVRLGSKLFAVHRLANAIGLLGVSPQPLGVGVNPNRLELHRVADANLVDQVIPLTADNMVSGQSAPNTRGPSADFTIVGTAAMPEFFYTYTTEASETGPFDLSVGRATVLGVPIIGPRQIFSSNDKVNPARPRLLVRAGSKVIMPLEQENNGIPTKSDPVLDTPDDANGPFIATARSVQPPGGKPNIFFGGGPSKSVPMGFNAAYVEVDTASSTAPITFRLGALPLAKATTFTAADVPVAFTFDSVSRLITDGGDPVWVDDQYLSIGRGQNVPGLNFFWYDAATRSMRVNQTGPDSFFTDHTKIRNAGIAFANPPAPIFAQFDLAWTESTVVDGGNTETLFYSEMSCIR